MVQDEAVPVQVLDVSDIPLPLVEEASTQFKYAGNSSVLRNNVISNTV
jgi:hypothetical protein